MRRSNIEGLRGDEALQWLCSHFTVLYSAVLGYEGVVTSV